MPPRDAVIQSPLARSAVIALLMWAMVGGSLALAWGLTGAPWRPLTVPAAQAVPIGGATLVLPGAWVLDGIVQEEGNPLRQWRFTNQASPAEQLRVVRFTATQETDPGVVMGRFVLPQLIAGRRMTVTPDAPPFRYERTQSEADDTTDLIFSTQRLGRVATSPQLHAVRLISPDRKNFWVFQLTDQVPVEQWNRNLEISHLEQLRRMLTGFAYQTSDEGDGSAS